jgi:hypothetical protein
VEGARRWGSRRRVGAATSAGGGGGGQMLNWNRTLVDSLVITLTPTWQYFPQNGHLKAGDMDM